MSKRIMIVEDDAIVANHLQRFSEQLGYEVAASVACGEDAVAQAGELYPDVVLMDIRLRGEMNGVEAAERIRAKQEIPIIYLTAFAEEESFLKTKLTQPYGYITKPIREKDLRACIEVAMYKSLTDKKLRHLNQVLRAIRNVDQLITRQRDPQKLLQEACHILVQTQGYGLVWIGRWQEENKRFIVAAQSGSGSEFCEMEAAMMTTQAAELPSLLAYKSQQTAICQDITGDVAYENLRPQALAYGFIAEAAIPMAYQQKMYGVVCVTVARQSALQDKEIHLLTFDEEETGLLKEVADDLAFGLHSIEEELKRKHAEKERRKLEEQMQQMQRFESLGILAGGIAHDFNNLLMAILGYTELALLELPPALPAYANLLEVEKAVNRAADLCKQMLAYAGKGQFVMTPVDMNELLNEMKPMLAASVCKKVCLRFKLGTELPMIEADATQIKQVAMNLCINSSEAIGDNNGVIAIATGILHVDQSYLVEACAHKQTEEGDYVYLEVKDSGCGMNKETLTKIFDPFFTTKFIGRGLGLPVVSGIVRVHKGFIKVESEVGKGATFRVFFPVSQPRCPEGISSPEGISGDPSAGWQGRGSLLVVDDEKTVQNICHSMLTSLGFRVFAASNGKDAVDIFQTHQQEIVGVVLDLSMPEMDGIETLQRLRHIKKDVKILMSSGYGEQEISSRLAKSESTAFIQKPYQKASLAKKLQELLL